MNLTGQIALIAGGTGGLGSAVSLAFVRAGAQVVVTYRSEQEFQALHASAANFPSALDGYELDVTDEAAVGSAITKVCERHSRIDILVNAVGAYSGGAPLWNIAPRTFDLMLDLNLRSGYALARAVVPVMLKQESGAIVNVGSKAAFDHAAGAAAYVASKAAAVAMMDSLAEDLRGTGVRVNSVLPSIIDTPANRAAMPTADFSAWPKPEEIARVILFLCSEDARLIHGAAIPVYGGA